MKLIFALALSLVSSVTFAAPSQKFTCQNPAFELAFEKTTAVRRLIGTYRYNKNSDGLFSNTVNLECEVTPLNNWNFADCIDTASRNYYSMYQMPQNAFTQKAGSVFSIVEIRESESIGEIGQQKIDNCILH